MKVSKKTEDRIISTVPKFQKVLAIAKARDLNESDTVAVITDILAEVFGYEKYLEITSELSIRGTFCDLAVKVNDKFQFLIECKAIGTELKEAHLRQAVGYGSNKGIQWIILTNGADWQIYRIRFEQPITWDLVVRFDMSSCSIKDDKFREALYLITKEGVEKGAREEVYERIQCVNRFVIGAIMLSEPVISTVKRELKRLADGIRIEEREIVTLIEEGVLKRDILEGEESSNAFAKVGKLHKVAPAPKRPPVQAKATSDTSDADPAKETSLSDSLLADSAAPQNSVDVQ